MVLGSGRGYDEIAKMLSIDRAGVRDRALTALDALGPETGVPEGRRQLITDYLLGQLPKGVAAQTREHLASSPTERAWARVVASELAPLASGSLPEIPAGSVEPAEEETAEAEPAAAGEEVPADKGPEEAPVAAPPEPEPAPAVAKAEPAEAKPAAARAASEPAATPEPAGPGAAPQRRVSRLGGAVLLGAGAAVVIAVVLVLVLTGGSSNKKNAATTPATPTTSATTTKAGSTTATPVAQINLLSPGGSKSTAGIAEVLKQGSNTAIAIVGQGLPANSKHNAYAVWLYNTPGDAVRLGFVNPGVGKTGRLETTGPLPTNAGHFKQLLLTIETNANPKQPGQIVLQGKLTGV
jgi:outer membrane biosynthesis protein TonB